MARKKIPIIHKPGGYEAYKDQVPIRKPNWRAIFTMVGFIFVCGAISSVVLFTVPKLFNRSNREPETIVENLAMETVTGDPAFNAIVSSPQATFTPSPTATYTPQFTVEPTVDLQATVDFVSEQLSLMQTQTALPSITPLPTDTPMPTNRAAAQSTEVNYSQYAVVIYDNVIVRASSGQQYEALDMAYRGQEFPVLETHNGWVRILHDNHDPAWIAVRLLRIEDR